MSNNNMDWAGFDPSPTTFTFSSIKKATSLATDAYSEPLSPLPETGPRKPPVNIRKPDTPNKATRLGGNGKIHYYADEIMGQGATSTVYRGYFEVETRKAAVKRLDLQFHHIYKNEIKILREVDNPNIIKYFTSEDFVDSDSNLFYIAMELANFTLEDCVNKKSIHYTTSQSSLYLYLKQACEGLNWLHNNQIIHRDIKPSNILITFKDKEGSRSAKLVDFGISKKFQHLKDSTDSLGKGTLDWMSPEALDAQSKDVSFKNTFAMDVFSMGLTFYFTMTSGEHAFGNKVFRSVNIMTKEPDYKHIVDSDHKNIALKNLINPMLYKEYKKRPKIGAVLKHPFFWDEKKQLEFIQDVSNSLPVKVEDKYQLSLEIDKLYINKIGVFEWQSKLSDNVKKYLPTGKKIYDCKSITKLIEFIRDKDQHWPEWPSLLKGPDEFGNSDETYIKYFIKRFPYIITFLYIYFQEPYFTKKGVKVKTVPLSTFKKLTKYYEQATSGSIIFERPNKRLDI